MILINLLPGGRRGRAWPTVTVRQGVVGLAAALALMTVWLGLWRFGVERAHRRLDAEWSALGATRSQVADGRARVDALERQAQRLARAKTERAQWAPRLNLLSDTLVPGVWFTRLTLAPVDAKLSAKVSPKTKGPRPEPSPPAGRRLELLVAGTALIPQGGEPSPLAALLRSLKQHPEFTRWFDAVELKSVERRKVGPLDVSDFVLRFEVREPSVSSTP